VLIALHLYQIYSRFEATIRYLSNVYSHFLLFSDELYSFLECNGSSMYKDIVTEFTKALAAKIGTEHKLSSCHMIHSLVAKIVIHVLSKTQFLFTVLYPHIIKYSCSDLH